MSNFQHPDPMIEFLVKQAEWAEFDLEELRRKELDEAAEEFLEEEFEEDEDEWWTGEITEEELKELYKSFPPKE